MLQLSKQDAHAFDEMTQATRSLIYYGLISLLNETERMQLHNAISNINNEDLEAFYNTISNEMKARINVLNDYESLSLLENFAK